MKQNEMNLQTLLLDAHKLLKDENTKLREILREIDVQYRNKKIDLPRELYGMIINQIGHKALQSR